MIQQPVVSIAGCSLQLRGQTILSDVDLTVAAGEIVAVVGANGSGKSTLLRIIVGLIRPNSGSVALFGRRPDDIAARRRVGAAIDTPALYPWMSGRAALRTLLNLGGEKDDGRTDTALRRFGLGSVGRKPVLRYSQGMRKRLALAAASMSGPELLLLDEPTNALDEDGRDLVRNWLADHRRSGGSAVLATHRSFDASLCDRAVRLRDGRLAEISASAWTAEVAARD